MSSACSHSLKPLTKRQNTRCYTVLLCLLQCCFCVNVMVVLMYCGSSIAGCLTISDKSFQSLINVTFPLQAILWLLVARWITFQILVTAKFLPDLVLSAIPLLTLCRSPCMMRGDRGILSASWRQILVWEGLIEES